MCEWFMRGIPHNSLLIGPARGVSHDTTQPALRILYVRCSIVFAHLTHLHTLAHTIYIQHQVHMCSLSL